MTNKSSIKRADKIKDLDERIKKLNRKLAEIRSEISIKTRE
jgi:hypothetical protein